MHCQKRLSNFTEKKFQSETGPYSSPCEFMNTRPRKTVQSNCPSKRVFLRSIKRSPDRQIYYIPLAEISRILKGLGKTLHSLSPIINLSTLLLPAIARLFQAKRTYHPSKIPTQLQRVIDFRNELAGMDSRSRCGRL